MMSCVAEYFCKTQLNLANMLLSHDSLALQSRHMVHQILTHQQSLGQTLRSSISTSTVYVQSVCVVVALRVFTMPDGHALRALQNDSLVLPLLLQIKVQEMHSMDQQHLADMLKEAASRPFDLATGPMIRAT